MLLVFLLRYPESANGRGQLGVFSIKWENWCAKVRILLLNYARKLIYAEEMHLDEVDKMLRKPGEIRAVEKK